MGAHAFGGESRRVGWYTDGDPAGAGHMPWAGTDGANTCGLILTPHRPHVVSSHCTLLDAKQNCVMRCSLPSAQSTSACALCRATVWSSHNQSIAVDSSPPLLQHPRPRLPTRADVTRRSGVGGLSDGGQSWGGAVSEGDFCPCAVL